jgi:hypothetical protein
MLNINIGHAEVGRQLFKKHRKCFKSTSGAANTNDGKGTLFNDFFRLGSLAGLFFGACCFATLVCASS